MKSQSQMMFIIHSMQAPARADLRRPCSGSLEPSHRETIHVSRHMLHVLPTRITTTMGLWRLLFRNMGLAAWCVRYAVVQKELSHTMVLV